MLSVPGAILCNALQADAPEHRYLTLHLPIQCLYGGTPLDVCSQQQLAGTGQGFNMMQSVRSCQIQLALTARVAEAPG